MTIFGIPWWLLLLILLALLLLLWRCLSGGSGGAGPLPAPTPYPSGSTGLSTGAAPIPQGRWSGPNRHPRRESRIYTFLRETYNPVAPDAPLTPASGIKFRLRLVHVPEENAEIVDVTNGGQVGEGSGWWGAVTGGDGLLEVEVEVKARVDGEGFETASSEESVMQIIAEELDAAGNVLHGAIHNVTVVPSGQ